MTGVEVRVRDCACPGSPHAEGDVVYVAPRLSLAGGLEATADIQKALGDGKLLAALWLVTFVKHGAIGWNFLDADGDPIPFDVDVLLADFDLAKDVAEKCDELYGETVARPLVESIRKLSQRGQTTGSTSRSSASNRTSPRRSSPRSTAGKR